MRTAFKILLLTIVALITIGCKTTSYAPSKSEYSNDSTYVAQRYIDSLKNATYKIDSIYMHDSIYVMIKGDTVTQYVERIRYQYKLHYDTIFKYKLKTDTMYYTQCDSIEVIKPVEIEKKLGWFDSMFLTLGKICGVALIIWLIIVLIKKKFF